MKKIAVQNRKQAVAFQELVVNSMDLNDLTNIDCVVRTCENKNWFVVIFFQNKVA